MSRIEEPGKNGEIEGKTQGIWKFCQNTGNFVGSIDCWFKFPDSKGKGLAIFAEEMSNIFLEANVSKVSVVYVIVTNHLNWHRKNLWSDREKLRKHRKFETKI